MQRISEPLGGKCRYTPKPIQELGLTQHKKTGDGVYERTAGTKGPEVTVRGQPNVKADRF
ncbi:MAG: hypothetical protein FJY51_12305 [Betaproteobacteria bacterium]|nr:hypothetical protein [Betaproteobacteria bacterium]